MPLPSRIYYGSTLIYDANVLGFPSPVESSAPVTVTASASTNTKGSWVELIASTDANAYWINVSAAISGRGNAIDTSFLLDIGTGASGSETVRIADLGMGYRDGRSTLLPIYVPSGTRVAARGQSNVASRAATVSCQVLSDLAPTTLGQTLDTYGATTATSRGTNLPTSNTYVEITSSTTQAYKALVATPTGSGTTFQPDTSTYTIARGASGSEIELFSFDVETFSTELLTISDKELSTVYVGDIPAGTRLAVKQSIGRNFRDVILHGVPA